MKQVVLLGSTGSIGVSATKVADDLPDHIRLVGLAAGNNAELLLKQTLKYRPEAVSICDPAKARELENTLGTSARVFSGEEGLIRLATLPAADIVLIAIVGTAGLQPALAAIRAGKDIAIASKEILVMAGEIVMREARKNGARVLAVDSEHSAIFQCLEGKPTAAVRSQQLLVISARTGAVLDFLARDGARDRTATRFTADVLGAMTMIPSTPWPRNRSTASCIDRRSKAGKLVIVTE